MQFSYGWDDAGWRDDETSLATFPTREAAQAEIDDLCKSMNAQLGADRRAEWYDPKDYRVVEVVEESL